MKAHQKSKFLFICKLRHGYGEYHDHTFSSGLYQSAKFIADMLVKNGYEARVVQVNDNNDIDRVVTLYRPTHAFIEALWVVPEKFATLVPLHPQVKFVIRVHSNTPFLAQEGIATDWLQRYLDYGPTVFINCNGKECFESLLDVLSARYELVKDHAGHRVDVSKRLTYLPNYYPITPAMKPPHVDHDKKSIDIGCFGAVRLLKDQLIQAIAALAFAEDIGKNLRFHINAGRVEGGNQPLKNLRNLFALQPRHELVEHDWLAHDAFLKLVESMDLGMQVSFSETFNICAADFANLLVPIACSREIPWANPLFYAPTTDSQGIVWTLKELWKTRKFGFASLNKNSLSRFVADAERRWLVFAAA